MSARYYQGYWTIYSGERPVLACTSFEAALGWLEFDPPRAPVQELADREEDV